MLARLLWLACIFCYGDVTMSARSQSNAPETYDQDFHAWAMEQGALLREGRVTELDLRNLAEEIESLGRSVKRDLVSRFATLLLHLLKWSMQPERQGTSWRLTIVEQREQLREHLAENPSLKPFQPEAVTSAYKVAVIRAERETGLLRDMFPWACPYTMEEPLDNAFWPEPY